MTALHPRQGPMMADPAHVHPTIFDAVCTACGCLCDDIDLSIHDGRIIAAERACNIGRSWFLADHSRGSRPIATIEGVAVSAESAIEQASKILIGAQSPLILGLTQTTIETQRVAVEIADRIGATIDPGRSTDSLPRWRAIQRVGIVSATLGEVRNRADVVVFWGVDPVVTHPRHLERYSANPTGRFIPKGRDGRTVIVVGADESATSKVADRFVRVEPDYQEGALTTLRMLIRGVEPTHVDPNLRKLAETMKSARYGAFFFGPSLGDSATVEEALKLVRDLNASTRFVALTMGGPGNLAGAEAVLTWQAGSPRNVDFSSGFPQFLPDRSGGWMLNSGQADAVLIVADDPADLLFSDTIVHLQTIPYVQISPRATDRTATVALNCSTTGIHTSGTILRCDGATLPLQPALQSDLPTDRDWLLAIRKHLEVAGK